ncbi:MAG: transcriptional repressor [Melioribacteraceae bacterium]|nr:transcriptional repressor [Melioribacteraceae bacterium]MCF8353791.1 transcriptional repressor [Melioribacteraceae bacterium]MCF8393627.1 transcriptional repressor [Melioribacteraceae bacterium]MCF8419437.1 transcriptional repressor [Melioribacteraceae bacterium]
MDHYKDIIKESGAKLTKPRLMVLEALYSQERPISLSDIADICFEIDFASVYRTIKLFDELGILQTINIGDKKPKYELETKKSHHHHIICSECGRIEKIDLCILPEIQKLTKFKIVNHSMEFIGICPDCNTGK